MINGIINVNKEAGFTSHDVVAKLRGILRQKKIGHTGTLDPDATGVLPVCLGKATKVCDLIGGWNKTYKATLLLGASTDTEDISGKVIQEKPVRVTEKEITSIMTSFSGAYDQIPPMYSAKKIKGRKLYELAREGVNIERKPCLVHIHSIDINEISLPRVTFTVTCSKGTYIRSLCRDIGEKAGCGGCMESLIRTAVADFKIDDSLSLAEIEDIKEQGRLQEILHPIDSVFMDYPAITVTEKDKKLLYNGNPLPMRQDILNNLSTTKTETDIEDRTKTTTELTKETSMEPLPHVRIYDPEGHFIGLYTADPQKERLKPYKLFFDNQD